MSKEDGPVRVLNIVHFSLARLQKIKQVYQSNKPYPHIVIQNFFKPAFAEKLRREIIEQKFSFIEKDLFSFYHTGELSNSRNEMINTFSDAIRSTTFTDFIRGISGKKVSGKHDVHGHVFEQGNYLLFHDDKVEDRVIAYIVNLSKSFKVADGGRLQLYDYKNPRRAVKSVVPVFNSLVLFTVSRYSLHAVEEVFSKKTRLTVGGWLYGA